MWGCIGIFFSFLWLIRYFTVATANFYIRKELIFQRRDIFSFFGNTNMAVVMSSENIQPSMIIRNSVSVNVLNVSHELSTCWFWLSNISDNFSRLVWYDFNLFLGWWALQGNDSSSLQRRREETKEKVLTIRIMISVSLICFWTMKNA